MIARWLHRDSTHHSADVARERLLKDRTLRRNRFQVSFARATSGHLGERNTPLSAQNETRLSPRAQKWQVIATARHFREHYLAELAYYERGNITVAIIRPYLAPSLTGESAFEIRVDGRGHTSIVRLEEERLSQNPSLLPRRLFVTLLILAALTSGALALFL